MDTGIVDTTWAAGGSQSVLSPEQWPSLPGRPLLGFDRLEDVDLFGGKFGLGCASASADLFEREWVFACHFENDPIMPGTMMIDGLLQLAGLYAAYAGFRGRGRALSVDGARFLREVTPRNRVLHYRIDAKRILRRRQILLAAGVVHADNEPCILVSAMCVRIVPMDESPAVAHVSGDNVHVSQAPRSKVANAR